MPEAQKARRRLVQRYGDARPETADVIVALGGDGLMLHDPATLHEFRQADLRHAPRHRRLSDERILPKRTCSERLAAAQVTVIHPLLMRARDAAGRVHRHHAINEVSLFRQTYQAARLRILVDGKERLPQLVADGILLATPAGSTAYNLSVRARSSRSMRRCWR